MAPTLTASSHDNITINLHATGLTPGLEYRLTRAGTVIHVWRATAATADWDDVLAPFGTPLTYAVSNAAGANVATATPITLPWRAGAAPVFTTDAGQWPILRMVSDPARGPIRIPISDYSGKFGIRATITPIIGAAAPSVGSDVRQYKRFDFAVLTSSPAMRQHLITYLQPGKVLHLRAPCVAGALDNVFFKALQVSERIEDRRNPQLVTWSVEAQQVKAPSAYGVLPAAAPHRTWGDVKALGTWGDVKAVGTWGTVWHPPATTTRVAPSGDAIGDVTW